MAVNWPTILAGSVLTTLLTLLGQLIIQQYRQRLTKETMEWDTRRGIADAIERMVNSITVGYMLADYEPSVVRIQLVELKRLASEAISSRGFLSIVLVTFIQAADRQIETRRANFLAGAPNDEEAMGALDSSYKQVKLALQRYRNNTPLPLIRLRAAFLPHHHMRE